ncbi:MAG: hypothetical protein OHK0029_33720 [Armatimonadaceae bacterium]
MNDTSRSGIGVITVDRFRFRHHFIDLDLPVFPAGEHVTGHYGHCLLTDLDNDGDLDLILGSNGKGSSVSTLYWYEYRAAHHWVRRTLGHDSWSDVGAVAVDINGDGCLDIVCDGVWYRNPGNARAGEFTRHIFHPESQNGRGAHDIVAADIDRDGIPEIIVLHDGPGGLHWYKIPRDPLNEPWEKRIIADGIHGAICPAGVADVDGDGCLDIVCGPVWYENVRGDGSEWKAHEVIPFGRPGPYGLCVRTVVTDLDRDGHNEIIMSEADIVGSRIAILKSPDRGKSWARQDLPQSFEYGSLHSLAVADFDGDGKLEIMANEQEELLPDGRENPRWVLWAQDAENQWREHILLDARLGGHDMVLGDVNANGLPDVCSKVWNPAPWNGAGGKAHVDFLENLSRG